MDELAPDEDVVHQRNVVEDALFTIKPRKGSIAPGESQRVVVSYHHKGADPVRVEHQLPVVLSVADGKQVRQTTSKKDCLCVF